VALISCGECNREISTLAKSCLGCGAPVEKAQAPSNPPQEVALPSPGTARNDKRITERIITNKSLEEVRSIVCSRFTQIQPKFSKETLSYNSSQMDYVRVSIAPIEAGYVIAIDHNYCKPSPWGPVFNIVGFGLIWYFLNIWVTAALLVLGLVMMAREKFSFERIDECVNNLKNEIA